MLEEEMTVNEEPGSLPEEEEKSPEEIDRGTEEKEREQEEIVSMSEDDDEETEENDEEIEENDTMLEEIVQVTAASERPSRFARAAPAIAVSPWKALDVGEHATEVIRRACPQGGAGTMTPSGGHFP